MPFDPFRRFRLRSHPVPSSIDEATDDPRRPHVIHGPKNGPMSVQQSEKPSHSATDRLASSPHIALTLDKATHQPHPERPPKRSPKSGVASPPPTDPLDAIQPTSKPTLLCSIASKFNISILTRSGSAVRHRPSMRTLSGDTGTPAQRPRSPANAVSPPASNFVSKQNREAALRERGLLPPRKDLSEQEREADERIGSFPSPVNLVFDGSTEAERLKAAWLATNRPSESSESERGPPTPPHLHETSSPPSPPDADALRRSSDGKMDQPLTGRPSCSSSMSPLSSAPCLEVLHEEPSEQGPFSSCPLSPANVPAVLSRSPDSPPSPTSPTLVESTVSCTLSSQCPGSTLESYSQSSHEKETFRSTHSLRRSGDRPRRVVGSSMSKFGTHSLTNLRRSMAGSLKSTVSSADLSALSMAQAQRAAIDPTMHSIGSILRAAGDIQDAERRRLSEIAFLD